LADNYGCDSKETGKTRTSSASIDRGHYIGLHVSEIWLWAVTFMQIDAVPDLESALYFSTVTATTVGYGDLVLEHNWRLLGSFEAMSGILVFGISTAFLMAVLRSGLADFFVDKE